MPTEEGQGSAIIAALSEQFPVIANEDEEAGCDLPSVVDMSSANAKQPIDLEDWVYRASRGSP
jgi:hypothetical protein